MSEDRQKDGEKFLDRWSRLKQEARTQASNPVPAKRKEPGPAPQLPSLESLSFDSDFSPFMHPEVDDGLRRMALKKLFSDPHFNRIDGLDVYIDDYTGADPIPAELLKSLMEDRRKLFARDEGRPDETAAGGGESPQTADAAPAAAGLPPAVESGPDSPHQARPCAAAAAPPPVTQPDPDEKLTAVATPLAGTGDDTRPS